MRGFLRFDGSSSDVWALTRRAPQGRNLLVRVDEGAATKFRLERLDDGDQTNNPNEVPGSIRFASMKHIIIIMVMLLMCSTLLLRTICTKQCDPPMEVTVAPEKRKNHHSEMHLED
jgi:hypothetical protein